MRNSLIGILMVCVLVFGVQGVLEAVPLIDYSTNIPDSRSGTTTLEVRPDQLFEITLNFDLTPRKRITNANGKYTDEAGDRVDRAGY